MPRMDHGMSSSSAASQDPSTSSGCTTASERCLAAPPRAATWRCSICPRATAWISSRLWMVIESLPKRLSRGKERPQVVEPLDPRSRRQRRENRLAVARRRGATIEQGDETAIAGTADEPPKALFQTNRRSWNHVVLEAVESARFECPHACHYERVARRRKRQPVDDDAREGVADDVNALPKGRGGEEHRTGRSPEPVEQVRARQLTLKPHWKGEALTDEGVYLAQPRVRGEEHEGSAAGAIETLFDQRRRAARELRRLRIDARRRDEQPRLPRVVEGRLRDELLRIVYPERSAHEGEGVVHRQRRAREHDALRPRKERRPQEIGDFVRRAVERVSPFRVAAFRP